MTLLAAAAALDAQAAGVAPNKVDVLTGTLALQALIARGNVDRDLLDASSVLELMATG